MKKILITGALGQLGRALYKEFIFDKEYKIYRSDCKQTIDSISSFKKLDIVDLEESKYIIKSIYPDIIINCAAQTKVDIDELEYEKTYDINVRGVLNLSKISKDIGARLIQISTDYVFDGEKNEPYIETDFKNPLNYYGKTKSESEDIVLFEDSNNIVIRTAWMYGEGKNFIDTIIKMSEFNDELNVVSDQYGTPTSAKSLAECIRYLIKSNCKYNLYHATCEGFTTWYEFAKSIFEILNKNIKINPIRSEEYNSKVYRPKYSVLENANLKKMRYKFPHWKNELNLYLTKKYIN